MNKWIEHVKQFAAKNNMSYGCAISDQRCKDEYRKANPKTKAKTKAKTIPDKKEQFRESVERGLMEDEDINIKKEEDTKKKEKKSKKLVIEDQRLMLKPDKTGDNLITEKDKYGNKIVVAKDGIPIGIIRDKTFYKRDELSKEKANQIFGEEVAKIYESYDLLEYSLKGGMMKEYVPREVRYGYAASLLPREEDGNLNLSDREKDIVKMANLEVILATLNKSSAKFKTIYKKMVEINRRLKSPALFYDEDDNYIEESDDELQIGKMDKSGFEAFDLGGKGLSVENPALYEKVKKEVYKQYPKHSAYRSGQLVKRYKEMGGTYSGKKPKGGLTSWFKEDWKDVGNEEYPVYRPTKRVSKDTPLTLDEIEPSNLKKQIALKQKIKGRKNLPPFVEKLEGGSLSDWFSTDAWLKYASAVTQGRNDYPPKMRTIIEKYGNVPILRMYACRTPVPSLLTSALNAVSFGEFSKRWEKTPHDKLFHLDLRIELATRPMTTILLEKNEVLNAMVNPIPPGKNTQCTLIPKNKKITMLNLLEAAKQIQGDKFFRYSAYNNNCQDFIMAMLKGVGVGTQENYDFIKQDTKSLFKGLDGTRKFANTVTDLGAIVNTITEGAGIREN